MKIFQNNPCYYSITQKLCVWGGGICLLVSEFGLISLSIYTDTIWSEKRQGDLQFPGLYQALPLRGEIKERWEEKCPRTLTASRLGKSLNWAALKHQHQNPSAGPKEPHSSTLGFSNSLAPDSQSCGFCYEWKGGVKTGRAKRAGEGRKSGRDPAARRAPRRRYSVKGLERLRALRSQVPQVGESAVRPVGAEVPVTRSQPRVG